MREIEFRAWLKAKKKMVVVFIIDFEQQLITYYEQDPEYDDVLRERQASFKDIELMQYTELKDKNGVKIFEGDIVKYDEKTAVVEYGYHNCGCCYSVYGFALINSRHRISALTFAYCKVIGNIYENPELLGGKE